MLNFLIQSNIFYLMLGVFIFGAIGSLFTKKYDKTANIFAHTTAIIGSIMGILFSGATLLQETFPTFKIDSTSQLFSISFNIDYLSAFFMLVISFIALLSSIYALDYVKHYYKKYSIGVLGFLYNIFIASMILVATTHNILFFLIVWEIMSLSSYFLVIYENKEKENIRAGSLYFIMTHIGTAFIIFSFLLMYSLSGSFEFQAIKISLINAPELIKNLIFLSALIGFGTKAGIIPFHIWLPSAHPAAPSHVSALMSGVMIKTGIYMLIRISLDLLPNAPLWWGVVILILGSISSLLGVLYALAEHDIKKLLAYHSIENIGIILLGLGAALVFSSAGLYSLAALGLIAALYHTANHATFKALLFLGAGSVISQTHTRNLEKYGGLIKYMPQTALFFLIGSMAISALPPLNGFFSEWLTFQALFQAVMKFDLFARIIFLLSIGSLAFTSGLAAACFVKAFGITFLARPRSDEVTHAKESGFFMLLGMAGITLLILGLGFFSGIVFKQLQIIAASLISFPNLQPSSSGQFNLVNIQSGFAVLSMPIIFTGIIAAALITYLMVLLFSGRQKVNYGITWDCGSKLTPRMEITATGFSRTFITIFRTILRPRRETEVEYYDESLQYFPKVNEISLELHDIYLLFIYKPIQKFILKVANQVKKIQIGYTNAYILYIFLTLIGILFVLII